MHQSVSGCWWFCSRCVGMPDIVCSSLLLCLGCCGQFELISTPPLQEVAKRQAAEQLEVCQQQVAAMQAAISQVPEPKAG